MPEHKRKKTPIPWEAADPDLPQIRSMTGPLDIPPLPTSAPDPRWGGMHFPEPPPRLPEEDK